MVGWAWGAVERSGGLNIHQRRRWKVLSSQVIMFSVGLTGRQSKSGFVDGGPGWICTSSQEGRIQKGRPTNVDCQQARVLPYPLTSFNGRFPRNNEPVRFAENPGGCGSLLLLPIPSEISPSFFWVYSPGHWEWGPLSVAIWRNGTSSASSGTTRGQRESRDARE